MSIIDLFDRGCAIRSEGDYLISWDQRHTCRDAQVSTYQVANGLRWLGVESNAKAAVLAGNDPLAWPCVLSIWRAVMVWVPLNPRNPPKENAGLVETFDGEVLLFQRAFAATVADIRARCPELRLICLDSPFAGALELEAWRAQQPCGNPAVEPGPPTPSRPARSCVVATGLRLGSGHGPTVEPSPRRDPRWASRQFAATPGTPSEGESAGPPVPSRRAPSFLEAT